MVDSVVRESARQCECKLAPRSIIPLDSAEFSNLFHRYYTRHGSEGVREVHKQILRMVQDYSILSQEIITLCSQTASCFCDDLERNLVDNAATIFSSSRLDWGLAYKATKRSELPSLTIKIPEHAQ